MTQAGFDALTHLDAEVLADTLPEVVQQAHAAGVGGWVVAGWDPARWPAVQHAARVTGGVVALGVHPWITGPEGGPGPDEVVAWLDRARPPVVGEIGLDHARAASDADRARQRATFRAQLAWAREHDRPVIVHAVRAVPEVLHIVGADGRGAAGAMLHGWSGGPTLALRATELGLHLSIGPLVVGRTPRRILESLAVVPRDRVLLETDSPEQTIRAGHPAMPKDLPIIAAAVAGVWGETTQVVLHQTGRSARSFFRVPVRGDHNG